MTPEASPAEISARKLWLWYGAAAAFIPAIGFHYVGEEATIFICSAVARPAPQA